MEKKVVESKKENKESKWTKEYTREYMRNYMRERWRRLHNVSPDRYIGERKNTEDEAKQFGEGAVEFVKQKKKEKREKAKAKAKEKAKERPPVTNVLCPVCHKEYMNTEGMKRKHDNTIRHKLAVEILAKNSEEVHT